MDAKALENEGNAAVEAASTLAELEEARVRYLGRKSPLKLALREGGARGTGGLPPPAPLPRFPRARGETGAVSPGPGYEVVDGREVETTRYNFDGLNFPEWHPARSPLHSLFLGGDQLLRTEPAPSP